MMLKEVRVTGGGIYVDVYLSVVVVGVVMVEVVVIGGTLGLSGGGIVQDVPYKVVRAVEVHGTLMVIGTSMVWTAPVELR